MRLLSPYRDACAALAKAAASAAYLIDDILNERPELRNGNLMVDEREVGVCAVEELATTQVEDVTAKRHRALT